MLVLYIEKYVTNIRRSTSACRIQVCAVATDTPDHPARRRGSVGASVTRPHRPTARGARAHSVPVRAESLGHQRCDVTRTTTSATSICARQSHTGHPSAVASQAESASSILVTRSTTKAQVRDPGLFAVRVGQLSRARFVPEGSSGSFSRCLSQSVARNAPSRQRALLGHRVSSGPSPATPASKKRPWRPWFDRP